MTRSGALASLALPALMCCLALELTLFLARNSKGKTGGLTEAQIDSLLVDFDQRARSGSPSGSSSSEADSDDADEAVRPSLF